MVKGAEREIEVSEALHPNLLPKGEGAPVLLGTALGEGYPMLEPLLSLCERSKAAHTGRASQRVEPPSGTLGAGPLTETSSRRKKSSSLRYWKWSVLDAPEARTAAVKLVYPKGAELGAKLRAAIGTPLNIVTKEFRRPIPGAGVPSFARKKEI